MIIIPGISVLGKLCGREIVTYPGCHYHLPSHKTHIQDGGEISVYNRTVTTNESEDRNGLAIYKSANNIGN